MKWKLLCTRIFLVLILSGWAGSALAVSKYTDKENALNLAEALDKGIFRNRLITATFIQSVGKGRYFVKVVLDNGAEHNWDLKRLRALSKQESILLSRNRALLFSSEQTNDFAALDKTRFSQQALAAKVYVKRYKSSDVLAGNKIAFAVSRFNLVHLLGLKAGRDENGYPYHYVLDLENGQREKLSYRDAYFALKEKALLADETEAGMVMHTPYRIREIKPIRLEPLGPSGMGKFGVELTFDRPVELGTSHFPFRFFENGNGAGSPKFVVELTAPNAVLGGKVNTIRSLEFLRNVHVVPDRSNPVRLLMRAAVTPDVINFPPEVEVVGSTVRVSFTKVMDQSVYDRQTLARKALRVRQDRLLHRTLLPEDIGVRKQYRGFMKAGNESLHLARRAEGFKDRYDAYREAMAAFQNAALNATNDLSLDDALRSRNAILGKLPVLVIRHVRGVLRGGAPNTSGLRELLEDAATQTRDKKVRRVIKDLIDRVQ